MPRPGATDLLAELLLDRKADPHARAHGQVTALHYAAAHGQLGALRMLLARGASAEARDEAGRLPLEYAVRGLSGLGPPGEGHAECHALLLQYMAR